MSNTVNLDFNSMGKAELRNACKAAGIAYGKLNNDGMRAALAAVYSEPVAPEVTVESAQEDVKPELAQAPQEQVIETPQVAAGPVREVTVGTVVAPKSLKIEKGRDESNGVRRPSTGSICRAIWDALDAHRAKHNATPSFENVRDLMKANSWSRNTAFTQFQRWKQFCGLMPRSSEGQDEESTAPVDSTPATVVTEEGEEGSEE